MLRNQVQVESTVISFSVSDFETGRCFQARVDRACTAFTWSVDILPTLKYSLDAPPKYRPDTDAEGSIAKDSVSSTPISFSTPMRSHIVPFSVWSG